MDGSVTEARTPTERDAALAVVRGLETETRQVVRFSTGLANYVFDVLTTDDRHVVVRLGRHGADFAAAVYWHRLLAPLGVPLPHVLFEDATPSPGTFPCLIMERLPGRDLHDEYPTLGSRAKRRLARQIVSIQRAVGTLPLGPGFGYAASYEATALHHCWTDVLEAELLRSRARLSASGAASIAHVDRVQRRLPEFRPYLDTVQPGCFLDDTTTKNVIVHRGELSGIVDVDFVCFGDPLLTVALTQMALLSRCYDTEYVEHWLAALDATSEQRHVLTLYTAIFCVTFLSEIGQRFNQDAPAPVDGDAVNRLVAILGRLMSRL